MKVIRSSLFTLSLLALSNCGGQTAFDLRAEGDASAGSRPLSVLDDASAGDDTPGPARDSSVVDDGDDETADDETDDSVADDDDRSEDDLTSDDTDEADEAADESSLDDDDDVATDDSSADDLATDESSDDLADDLVLDDIDDLVADEGVTDDEALDDLVTDDDDSTEDDSVTDDDATDDSDDDDSATDDDATDDDTDPTPTSTGTGTTPTSTSTGTTPTSTSTGTTPTSTSTGTTPTTTSTSTQPPPPEELPEECDPPSTYNYRGSCYLSTSCEDEYLSSNCYQQGSDWICYCYSSDESGYHSLELDLTNLGSLDACTFAANLCSTKTTIEFPDEEECEAPSESVYGTSCSSYTTCTRSVEFQGGVEAVSRRQKTTNCYSNGDDIWGCDCYDAGARLSFEMASEAEPRNVCKSATSICETGITIDPQAPIECEQTSGWGDRNNRSCNAELTCAQGATVSEASITLFGSVWTSCNRGTGNAWACECSSGQDSAEYQFTTSTTEAFDVCSEAAAYCEEQDLVQVQVSSGGGFPIPL